MSDETITTLTPDELEQLNEDLANAKTQRVRSALP
jgi:hypothetical protein